MGLKRSLFGQVCEAEGAVVGTHGTISTEGGTRVVILFLLGKAVQIFERGGQST